MGHYYFVQSAEDVELGADAFFPVWLYVVAHANIPDLNQRMSIMDTYMYYIFVNLRILLLDFYFHLSLFFSSFPSFPSFPSFRGDGVAYLLPDGIGEKVELLAAGMA